MKPAYLVLVHGKNSLEGVREEVLEGVNHQIMSIQELVLIRLDLILLQAS